MQTEPAATLAEKAKGPEVAASKPSTETTKQRPEASLCNPNDTTTEAPSPVYPILLRETPGGRRARPASPDVDALLRAWDCDAHIVQYEGSVRRNKVDVTPDSPLVLSLELYDFDNKSMPDDERAAWSEACLSKLPDGFIGYRTAGGFRALTLRERPFLVTDAETWEDWRQYHGGRAEALGRLIGAEPDHSTDEPNRLFRLPNVRREDGKPSYPKLYGTIGYATLAPAPWERQPATEVFAGGDAQQSKAGAVFSAAGLVQRVDGQKLIVTCPWAHEHSGRNTSGTFIDDDADHLGHFVCMHDHCRDRTTDDAIEALQGLPAVAAELRHWHEPSNILMPYERVDEVPTAPEPPQPAAKAPDSKTSPRLPAEMFATMSRADFDAEDSAIPWVIEKLVAQGEPTMLVAKSEGGKSTAIISMALSVATGKDVWGRFRVVKPGPVVHIDYEQGKSVKRSYREIGRGLGINDVGALLADGRLRLATLPRAQLLDPWATDEYVRAVSEQLVKLCEGASLCVLNSLTASTNQVSENDPKVARVFNMLTGVAERTGCAFFVIHHAGRGEDIRARGSSAIDGAVQSIFCCDRPSQPEPDFDADINEGFTEWWQDKDRLGTGKLKPFRMTWRREKAAGMQTLRAEDPAEVEQRPRGESDIDRIQDQILKGLQAEAPRGHVSGSVLEKIDAPDARRKAVWAALVAKRIVMRTPETADKAVNNARWRIADGVVVSAHAHEPITLDGSVVRLHESDLADTKRPSKRPEYRRALRTTGRAA